MYICIRDALVLDTLLTTFAEVADMKNKRRLFLTCWVHARLFAKGEGSNWVFTTSAQYSLSESIQIFWMGSHLCLVIYLIICCNTLTLKKFIFGQYNPSGLRPSYGLALTLIPVC